MAQIAEFTLNGMAHGGEAWGHHADKVIFVPYAIPGERVRAEIVEEKPRWARARLSAVLEPSPDRVEPPCPYFGPDGCGGCQWQHIAYERQATLKEEIVADQLRRLGRLSVPTVADIIGLANPNIYPEPAKDLEGLKTPVTSDAPSAFAGDNRRDAEFLAYHYRNQVRFAASPEGKLGYPRAASNDVIPVDHCLLLHASLDDLYTALDITWPELAGITLRAGVNTGQALVLLETKSEELPALEINLPAACAILGPRGVQPLIGEPWIEEEVAGRHYRVSAGSFFQANTIGAAALLDIVSAYADPRPADVLLGPYCGVGLFALTLADSVAEVIGIESSASTCEDFAHNASDRRNVTLHEGAVEAVLPVLRDQGQRVDLVVMEPPRTGAAPGAIGDLAALRPRRIIYVSCDSATLARDSLHLTAGGYRLVEAQPVDIFPQTHRVETVALWKLE